MIKLEKVFIRPVNPNPVITGIMLLAATVGGVSAAKTCGEYYERVTRHLGEKISIARETTSILSGKSAEDDDDE